MARAMKFSSSKGFTLIEVMFAMAILAIGILGVISLQGIAIKGNMSAKDVMVATTLAHNGIDYFHSIKWQAPNGTANLELADTSPVVSPGGSGNPAVFPNGYVAAPGNPFSSSGIPSDGPPAANPVGEGDFRYFVGWRIDDDPTNTATKGNCIVPLVTGDADPSCSKAITVRVQWLEGNLVRNIEVHTIKTSGY